MRCLRCGVQFKEQRSTAKYCGYACRWMAKYYRDKASKKYNVK